MLTDEWKCNRIHFLSTGFQQTALNCTARCHQGLAFHTYKLEVNLNKRVECVNWTVLQTPVQTPLLRTAAFLWPEISWGVTQALLQLDALLPLAWSGGKWDRSELNHLHSSLRELVSLPRVWEGLAAVLPNLPIQQQGQEREGWEKQLFQGLSKNKLGNGCSLFLQVLGLQHWWKYQHGETQVMKMGQKWFLLNLKQPGMASWLATASWE